ncbi:hypothetical protein RCC89_02045 [Cytophagaceae bacterium ABcell3]|nr:hypothetical protein RCC89_02045 [Cytophagaceae bacterium ABcell3]
MKKLFIISLLPFILFSFSSKAQKVAINLTCKSFDRLNDKSGLEETSFRQIIYQYDSVSNSFFHDSVYIYDVKALWNPDTIETLNRVEHKKAVARKQISYKSYEGLLEMLNNNVQSPGGKVKLIESPYEIKLYIDDGKKIERFERDLSSCEFYSVWKRGYSEFFNPDLESFVFDIIPKELRDSIKLVKYHSVKRSHTFHKEELEEELETFLQALRINDTESIKNLYSKLLPNKTHYEFMFRNNMMDMDDEERYMESMHDSIKLDGFVRKNNQISYNTLESILEGVDCSKAELEVEVFQNDVMNVNSSARYVPKIANCTEIALVALHVKYQGVYRQLGFYDLKRIDGRWILLSPPVLRKKFKIKEEDE